MNTQYVLLDYSKDDGKPDIASGSKEVIEAKFKELKNTQDYLDDPGRYDIMPLAVYCMAFGG